jgi:hypothetical protein
MSLADNSTWKAVKPFLNGGLSGMGATCIIQPLDIVKVRAKPFSLERDDSLATEAGMRSGANRRRRARALERRS